MLQRVYHGNRGLITLVLYEKPYTVNLSRIGRTWIPIVLALPAKIKVMQERVESDEPPTPDEVADFDNSLLKSYKKVFDAIIPGAWSALCEKSDKDPVVVATLLDHVINELNAAMVPAKRRKN